MERDEKGRFVKGNSREISAELAREYQLKSAESRKYNRTVAETLREALTKKASSGSPMTKLEYLTEKTIQNHATGKMTFKDLADLQKVLGEEVTTVNVNGPLVVTKEEAEALDKWTK